MTHERRRRRSEHFPRAVRLQLASLRQRAGLQALILTGKRGMLLASDGDDIVRDKLVVISAKLAPLGRRWRQRFFTAAGCAEVFCVPVRTQVGQLHLCAVGAGGERAAFELERAGHGLARILASSTAGNRLGSRR